MSKNAVFELLVELDKKIGVTELIINKNDSVYVEKDSELIRLDITFTDAELEGFCQEIATYNRREFSPSMPILDGNLPDGSRVNLIHKDYTKATHAITVRRFVKSLFAFDKSPGVFGLTPAMVNFFKILVRARVNIVVAGGTGVGKTTLLNLFLNEIHPKERIISIEDTRELQIGIHNAVRLEARVLAPDKDIPGLTVRELLKNTLRMRPDRIILGECRGGEVFDLLQAMNTGHEGSMTSVHANSPAETLLRLENLYMLSGYDLPLKALRYQISTAIDFVVQLRRDKNGHRIISHISEVAHMEGDKILMQDLAVIKDNTLKFTGLVPAVSERLQKAGLPKDFFTGT